jgi:hypothetical protein
VTIPLTEFRKGKAGKQFDRKTVWEFNFSVWSNSPRDFDIFFDELRVEKR